MARNCTIWGLPGSGGQRFGQTLGVYPQEASSSIQVELGILALNMRRLLLTLSKDDVTQMQYRGTGCKN